MHNLSKNSYQSLEVDYGEITGRDTVWKSYSGEEFSVVNPLDLIAINVSKFIPTEERRSLDLSLASKPTRIDQGPFHRLPTELTHHILHCITGHALSSLHQASRSVRQAIRSSSFWKRQLLREQVWLWHTPFSVDFSEPSSGEERPASSSPIDWEKLYIILEVSTAQNLGTRGGLMALANRRQVWKFARG